MPPRRLVIAFLALWITLGIVVFIGAVQTLFGAVHGRIHTPLHGHLALLAGVEAVAAALFLIPGTLRVGGIGLLATFTVAITVHVLSGEFPGALLLYAAGTVFVLVHGPVPLSWARGRNGAPDWGHHRQG